MAMEDAPHIPSLRISDRTSVSPALSQLTIDQFRTKVGCRNPL